MAGLAEGFLSGIRAINSFQAQKLDREKFEFSKAEKIKERELLTAANKQTSSLMKQIFEDEIEENQQKVKALSAVAPLTDIVSKKPGPLRSGGVEVFSQALKAEDIELSPIARKVLEKESSDVAVPIAREVQRNVREDPLPSLKKYGEILSSDEKTAQFLSQANKSAAQTQIKGKSSRGLEAKRLGEIQVLKSKNRRMQKAMAALPTIGAAAPLARKQIQDIINKNNSRIDELQETRIVKDVGLGADKPGQTGSFLIAEESGEKLRQLGTKQALGKTPQDIGTKFGQQLKSKVLEKRITRSEEDVGQALNARQNILQAQEFLKEEGMTTGTFENMKLGIGKFLEAAGFEGFAKRISKIENAETFKKVAGNLALSALNALKIYPVSNIDLAEVKTNLASLTSTEEANQFILRATKEGTFSTIIENRLINEILAESDTPGDIQAELFQRWDKTFKDPSFRRFATTQKGDPIWFNEFYEEAKRKEPDRGLIDIAEQWQSLTSR